MTHQSQEKRTCVPGKKRKDKWEMFAWTMKDPMPKSSAQGEPSSAEKGRLTFRHEKKRCGAQGMAGQEVRTLERTALCEGIKREQKTESEFGRRNG